MLFAQTFFYLLIGLGTALGLPALWLFVRAKWPNMVTKGKVVSSKRLIGSFFIGFPVLILGGFLAQRLASSGKQPLQVVALLFAALMLVWAFAGAAGLATYVGERLWPQYADAIHPQSWQTTWKGGLVLVGCLLIPFVGWFLLILLLPIIGAGMQVRAMFTRQPTTAPALTTASTTSTQDSDAHASVAP